jgi:DNA-binding IclR family transcriptional regulator
MWDAPHVANSTSSGRSTERLMQVLATFTAGHPSQTASEIGRHAGLPSSTAHRMVADLVANGVLQRDEDGRLRIGLRLWELTTRSSRPLWLRQAALPHMEEIQARVGQHTQLVVLEGEDALCVERLSSPEAGENITLVAGRLPLHASSSGLVLLAHQTAAFRERILGRRLRRVGPGTVTDPVRLRAWLGEIRDTGQVVAPGSVSAVSTGVAVPLRDGTGEVIAALSVILPRESDPAPALRQLERGAQRITLALGTP